MEYTHFLLNWDPSVKLPLISWSYIMAFNFGYVSGYILEKQDMRVA